jgi:hypothetical protein
MENHKDEHGLWQLLGSHRDTTVERNAYAKSQAILEPFCYSMSWKRCRQMTDVFLRMLDEEGLGTSGRIGTLIFPSVSFISLQI